MPPGRMRISRRRMTQGWLVGRAQLMVKQQIYGVRPFHSALHMATVSPALPPHQPRNVLGHGYNTF